MELPWNLPCCRAPRGDFLLDLMAARESRTIHIIGNSQSPFTPARRCTYIRTLEPFAGSTQRARRARPAPPWNYNSMNEKSQWNVNHWNLLERKLVYAKSSLIGHGQCAVARPTLSLFVRAWQWMDSDGYNSEFHRPNNHLFDSPSMSPLVDFFRNRDL